VTLKGEATAALFSESQTRFVVSVKKENQQAFEQLIDAICIGEVTNSGKLIINNENDESLVDASVEELKDAWKGAIPCLLKSRD
jgi:phosphoribosylformylglycinamidine synthase